MLDILGHGAFAAHYVEHVPIGDVVVQSHRHDGVVEFGHAFVGTHLAVVTLAHVGGTDEQKGSLRGDFLEVFDLLVKFPHITADVVAVMDDGGAVATELEDNQSGVDEFERLFHQRFADSCENGTGTASERIVVNSHTIVAIQHDAIDFGTALEGDGALFDLVWEFPTEQCGTGLGRASLCVPLIITGF